jgi:hypothetical protein
MLKKSVCFSLNLAMLAVLVSCSSSTIEKKISAVYFINSATVGILLSEYKGGGGLPGTPDEHPHDYSQKIITYNVAAGSQTDLGVLSQEYPFGLSTFAAESVLVLGISFYSQNECPYYSLEGVKRGDIPKPTALTNPSFKATSSNGRYFLFFGYNSNDYSAGKGQVYDLATRSYSESFAMSTDEIARMETDGIHCMRHVVVYNYVNMSIPSHSWLVRQKLDDGAQDTILETTGYKGIFHSNPCKLIFTDPQGHAGYFHVDTTAATKARFISFGVQSRVMDMDTASGWYVVAEYDDNIDVYLGNYKTGSAEKKIFP